jgi:hypothetical protein
MALFQHDKFPIPVPNVAVSILPFGPASSTLIADEYIAYCPNILLICSGNPFQWGWLL